MELKQLILWTKGPGRPRICLYGPTGSGKTARIEAIAQELGRPLIKLLLSQSLPEDLFGMPRPVHGNGTIAHYLPAWVNEARRRPCIIFLDELDKAPEECMAAALTFLWNQEVHGEKLHQDSIIVAAMQPVDPEIFLASETGRALAARLLFVPIAYDFSWVLSRHGLRTDATEGWAQSKISLPVPPPSNRSVDMAIDLALWALARGTPQDQIIQTLSGLVPHPIAVDLIERILQAGISAEAVAAAVVDDPLLIEKLSPPEIASVLGIILEKCPPEIWCKAAERLLIEGNDETIAAGLKAQWEYLYEKAKQNGGEVEVAAGRPADEFVKFTEEMLARVADVYVSRNKAHSEKKSKRSKK